VEQARHQRKAEVARLSREHCRKRNESKRPTTFVRVFKVTQRDKPPKLDKKTRRMLDHAIPEKKAFHSYLETPLNPSQSPQHRRIKQFTCYSFTNVLSKKGVNEIGFPISFTPKFDTEPKIYFRTLKF